MNKVTYTAKQVINLANFILRNHINETSCLQICFNFQEVTSLMEYLFYKPSDLKIIVWNQRNKLNMRRRRFVGFYIKTFGNGAEAARRAGYSVKCAKQIAYRLLHS